MVTLRLASPVHCGFRTVGNLKQTRKYVPGMALWGALTARLARTRHENPAFLDYQAAGEQIHQDLRYSYLYLSRRAGQLDCLPWGETAAEFDWQSLESGGAAMRLHTKEELCSVRA